MEKNYSYNTISIANEQHWLVESNQEKTNMVKFKVWILVEVHFKWTFFFFLLGFRNLILFMIFWLFFLYFMKNSITYWVETRPKFNRVGNLGFSFYFWENLGVDVQPSSHQMWYMATFNMRTGLKNEMRTKSPYENHPTLMQMHNNVISTNVFVI